MFDILTAIIHAALLAFGLIMPLGMQNIFIFNQGATQHYLPHALPSIITAAICDTILIILAVFGVSLLVLQIEWLKLFIFVIGFIFLLYMGYITWNHAGVKNLTENNYQRFTAKKQILFALSVSLLNPHAIIDTIAVIGTNSIKYHSYAKLAYTITCISVSWVWFFGLALAGYNLNRVDKSGVWIKNINKISAIIIWIVAIYIGLQINQLIYILL